MPDLFQGKVLSEQFIEQIFYGLTTLVRQIVGTVCRSVFISNDNHKLSDGTIDRKYLRYCFKYNQRPQPDHWAKT